MIVRRCAWHPKYHARPKTIGVRRWWEVWRLTITHGICADCKARVDQEIPRR